MLEQLQEVLGKALESGQLLSLQIYFRDTFLLSEKVIKDYDLSKLKTLKVDFIGDFKDQFSRAWMKTMTSQVRLETLEIWKQECQICPCDILDLQKNTLRSFLFYACCSPEIMRHGKECRFESGFTQSLLVSQSETLKTVTLSSSAFRFISSILLPTVQSFSIHSCRLDGWENLFGSFPSLKTLSISDVYFLGPLSLANPSILEQLHVCMGYSFPPYPSTWLDSFSKSCLSLRNLPDIRGCIHKDSLE